MTTQHTPGPWEFDGRQIVSPERYVCTMHDWSAPTVSDQYAEMNRALHEEAQANARLIAAAPDLLEALRFISAEIGGGGTACEKVLLAWKRRAVEAIAKAEGVQQ